MFFDLSHRLNSHTPIFPGDDSVELIQTRRISEDQYNNFRLTMSVHTGTHLDTPRHFFEKPGSVAEDPLTHFCGPAVVFNCLNTPVIELTTQMEQQVNEGDIVLIRTGFDFHWRTDAYFRDYPVMADSLAEFLVDRRVKIVGVDCPGPDKYPYPLHVKFFNANIYLLENLCELAPLIGKENIEVFAFPLKIESDASPVRVVARVSV